MAGRPPPSFKTDVNRQKTKKWTDAKSYSYEGDDWGGYDEFGEYGTYDQPSSAKSSATGFRQPGQALPPVNTNIQSPPPPTAPTYHRSRINSFEVGDDRRILSAGAGPPPGPPSSIDPNYQYSSSRTVSQPLSGGSYDNADLPFRSAPPDGGVGQQTSFSPPPRKSSLSMGSPDETSSNHQPLGQASAEATVQTESQPPPKPITFIRPADIYKRMQEEKEKERRSMESSRTSLDSMDRSRSNEKSSLASPVARARESSGSPAGMRGSLQTVPERRSEYGFDGASLPDFSSVDQPQQAPENQPTPVHTVQPEVEPNDESEDEPEAVTVQPPPSLVAARSAARLSDPSNAPVDDPTPEPTDPTTQSASYQQYSTESSARSSTDKAVPSLPQLGRMSGFANDFWNLSSSTTSSTTATEVPKVPQVPTSSNINIATTRDDQPSPGFRSAVEYAFGPSNQVQSPATLSGPGSQRSVAGSEISGTNSTAGVSPIMSRVPSGATAARQAQERADLVNAPAIVEEVPETVLTEDRPASSSTLTGPVAATGSELRNISSQSESAASVTSAFRQDPNWTDPATNPAKYLAVETETAVPESSTAEFGFTSPTSLYTQTPASGDPGDLSRSGTETFGKAESVTATTTGGSPAWQIGYREPVVAAVESGRFSPSKGRVKDLASQYNSIQKSRSDSVQSVASGQDQDDSMDVSSSAGPGTTAFDGVLEQPRDLSSSSAVTHSTVPIPTEIQTPDVEDESSITHTPDDMHQRSQQATPTPYSAPLVEQNIHSSIDASNDAAADMSDSNLNSKIEDISERGSQTQSLPPQVVVSSAASMPEPSPLPEDSPSADVAHDVSGEDRAYSPLPLRQAVSPLQTPVERLPIHESGMPETTTYDSNDSDDADNDNGDFDNDDRDDDMENDRLREDIVRTLNQTGQDQSSPALPEPSSRGPTIAQTGVGGNDVRESFTIPREYDSYWATSGHFGRYPGTVTVADTTRSISPANLDKGTLPSLHSEFEPQQPSTATEEALDEPQPKQMLTKRFSWEESDDEFASGSPIESPNSPTASHDFALGQRSFEPTSHTATETSPISSGINEPNNAYTIPEITFGDSTDPTGPTTITRDFDLPDPSPVVEEKRLSSPDDLSFIPDNSVIASDELRTKEVQTERDAARFAPPVATTASSTSAQLEKLPPFKEILNMKQTGQRIQTYNQTREGFAGMQTGLNEWLTYMVSANPEYAKPAPESELNKGSTATALASSVRSKILNQSSSQPYYQQYLNAPGALPPTTSGPAASGSASGQTESSHKYKTSSGAPPTPGEKLLFSAGRGAKGLIAKGKNKMKGGSSSDKGKSSSSSSPKFASLRGLQSDKSIDKDASARNAAPPRPSAQPSPVQQPNQSRSAVAKLDKPAMTPIDEKPSFITPNSESQSRDLASENGPFTINESNMLNFSTINESEAPKTVRKSSQDAQNSATASPSTTVAEQATVGSRGKEEPGLTMTGDRSLAMVVKSSRRGSQEQSLEPQLEGALASPENRDIANEEGDLSFQLPPGVVEAVVRASMDSFRTAPDDTPSNSEAADFGTFGSQAQTAQQTQSTEPPDQQLRRGSIGQLRDQTTQAEPVLTKKLSQPRRSVESGELFPDLANVESSEADPNPTSKLPETILGDEFMFLKEIDAEFAPRKSAEHTDRDPNALLLPDDELKPPPRLDELQGLGLRQTISQDSKESVVTETEIHPAMRNLSRGSVASSQLGNQPSTRPGPAVDPQSLPPSVRKQYLQPGPDERLSSATSEEARASSTNISARNQSFDTARSQTSHAPSLDTDGDYQRNNSSWDRFRKRSRGTSTGEQEAPVGPSPLRSSVVRAEDQEVAQQQQPQTSPRRSSNSPWRRFRAGSQGLGLENPDEPATAAFDAAQTDGGGAEDNTTQERPKSPFRMFRPRSRGKSLETAEPIPDSLVQESTTTKNEPRSKSPFRHFRPRSRGKSLETADEPIEPAIQATAPVENEERPKSPFRHFRSRSRGKSLEEADATIGGSSQNPVQSERTVAASPPQERDKSPFRMFRPRSRGKSLETPDELSTAQSQDTAVAEGVQRSESPSFRVYRESTRVGSLDLAGAPPRSSLIETRTRDQVDQMPSSPPKQSMSTWQRIKARAQRGSVDLDHDTQTSAPQAASKSSTTTRVVNGPQNTSPSLPIAAANSTSATFGGEGAASTSQAQDKVVPESYTRDISSAQVQSPQPTTNTEMEPMSEQPKHHMPPSQSTVPPQETPTPPPQSSTPPPRYSSQVPPVGSLSRSSVPSFRSSLPAAQIAAPTQRSYVPSNETSLPPAKSSMPPPSHTTSQPTSTGNGPVTQNEAEIQHYYNPTLHAPQPVNPLGSYNGNALPARDMTGSPRRFSPAATSLPAADLAAYNGNMPMSRDMMARSSSIPMISSDPRSKNEEFDEFGMPLQQESRRASRTKRNSVIGSVDTTPQSNKIENKRRSWLGGLFGGASSAQKERLKSNNRLSKVDRRSTEPTPLSIETTERWVRDQRQTSADPQLREQPSKELQMSARTSRELQPGFRTSNPNPMGLRSTMEPPAVVPRTGMSRRSSREQVIAPPQPTIDENSDQLLEAPIGGGPYPRFSHKHYLQTHGVLPTRPSGGQSFPLDLSPDVRASLVVPTVDPNTEAQAQAQAQAKPAERPSKQPQPPRNTLRRRGGPPRPTSTSQKPSLRSKASNPSQNNPSEAVPQPLQFSYPNESSQVQQGSWTPPGTTAATGTTIQARWDPSANSRAARPYMGPPANRMPLD